MAAIPPPPEEILPNDGSSATTNPPIAPTSLLSAPLNGNAPAPVGGPANMDVTNNNAHAPMTNTTSQTTMLKAPPAPSSMAPPTMAQNPAAAAVTAASQPSRMISLSPDFEVTEEKKEEEVMSEAEAKPAAVATTSAAPSKPPPSTTASATAAAPSGKPMASSAAAADADSPRRTGRKRTSTTMVIDGHVVKTANNYTVTGINYVHGAYTADAPKPKKPKPSSAQNKSTVPKTPRVQAPYLVARAKHNEVIKKRIFGQDNTNRLHFMTNHLDALEPFVDNKTMTYLKSAQKHSKPEPAKTPILGSQPDCIQTTLRDYQMIGLDWMSKMHARGMPFILGDEMGLGKTLQTIALIAHLKETQKYTGPSLVICPLSVLYSWCNEVVKHAPTLKHFRFHASDPKERESQKDTMLKNVLEYDIIITTYEMAKNPMVVSLIRGVFFNLCVLDEGHVIKSLTSQISESVRKIHSQGRVILTGTPMQNNLVELYAILNYLYPQYFTTPDAFESAFNITLNQIDPSMLLKANKLLKLFMIRRLKGEVEKLMPKKVETKILCPLSSSQVFWYKGFLMNEIESLVQLTEKSDDPDEEVGKGKGTMLRNLIMQLRKICLHPYLFDFAEVDSKNTTVEELIATSGKLAVLDKLLRSMFKNGHRTCIFSQFTSMLNILEDYCVLRGWKYCRFDGSTPRAQRNHIINQFNAPGSDCFIFLMSTRSGGLGINLQTADTCILYDSDWNPQPDLQAMARVHRIGQTKTVHVYRLLSAGTVEERIVERAEKKLYLDQMVNRGISNRDMDEEGGGVTTSELLASLTFGSNAVFSSSNDMPSDADIDKVTDRTRSEDSSDGLLKGGVTKTANDFDKDKELTDTRQFCGVDFRKLREEKEARSMGGGGVGHGNAKNKFLDNIKQDWKQITSGDNIDEMGKGKRVRKSRILKVAGLGSGYGAAHVPVLAINDYDLQSGEPSSWGRETKKVKTVTKKKVVNKFIHQNFCQMCGDGGMLIECPRCPISVHSRCCGLQVHEFQSCTHHQCVLCQKNASGAGGLIYRCQSCPNAYCPDCLPNEPYRYLGINVPRFEKLGFQGNPLFFYIHCSKQCEEVAKAEFGFKLEKTKPKLPSTMNVSYAFGKDAMDVKEMSTMFKEKAVGTWVDPKKKSPPRAAGARASPRKRSPKPKGSGGTIDLSESPPPAANNATGYTGYI